MKKINVNHNDKDRIVCLTTTGKHELFYQPNKSKERYWLFDVEFSRSIFAYFRDHGRNLSDLGFSLTLGELYRFRRYDNPKLARLIERIPGQVEYIIREYISEPLESSQETVSMYTRGSQYSNSEDRELAA